MYRNSYYHPRNHVGKIVSVVVLVVLALVGSAIWFTTYNAKYSRTLTVCSKEAVATKDGHEYRIYTSSGTFVMADSMFGTTRFDTADAYSKVQEKTTYDVTYKGWRLPFLSEFPNILSLKKTENQTPELCDGYS